MYSMDVFLRRHTGQRSALGILDHALDHGFIDLNAGFICAYSGDTRSLTA